jgi:hypothetical protein
MQESKGPAFYCASHPLLQGEAQRIGDTGHIENCFNECCFATCWPPGWKLEFVFLMSSRNDAHRLSRFVQERLNKDRKYEIV